MSTAARPSGGPRPGARRPPAAAALPWRERLAALRHVPALLRLVWRTHRGYAAAVAALRLARAGVPVLTLWVGKLLVDAVVASARGAGPIGQVWRLLAVEVAVVVAGELLARASALCESLLGDRFANVTSVRLMEHAAALDLAQLEDPAVYDQLERARRQTTGRVGLFTQLLGMAQDALTFASLAGALAAFDARLVALLAAAVLPGVLGEAHFAALGYSLVYQWTPERRRLDYLRWVGASERTAKEVQAFGLAPWLVGRYRALAAGFEASNRRLATRRAGAGALLGLVGTAGYYGAYALVLARAAAGLVSLGTLTFLAGAFARSRDLLQRLLSGATDVVEQAMYLRDLFGFFELRPAITSPPDALPVPDPLREGFVFEDVGFRYPGSDRWAVRHVHLRVGAGERVAIVGENGSGKTTLTKLLARLYDPTEGRVLLDGVDLRAYDVAALRAAVGVIFQDFVRYDLDLEENIGVGDVGVLGDGGHGGVVDGALLMRRGWNGVVDGATTPAVPPSQQRRTNNAVPTTLYQQRPTDSRPTDSRILEASDRSLASSLLPRLPAGYRQMLGRRFDEGVDLSGGEWQKVALARAYLRDAQVLVLDEPTAALDARAEAEVFRRFGELAEGRAAVLISHRFSTVRMADRIVVLEATPGEGGRVLEEGTHEELLARGGAYAELFALQAAGYR